MGCENARSRDLDAIAPGATQAPVAAGQAPNGTVTVRRVRENLPPGMQIRTVAAGQGLRVERPSLGNAP